MSSAPKSPHIFPHGQKNSPPQSSTVPYENRLDADLRWALNEGSLFFEEKGSVHEALRKITRRLEELGIPYGVVGGLALFRHGYRRFTEDVDLLVTAHDLRKIHDQLEGLGYVAPFKHSKNLRDTELGVKVEFLVTGGYPGDGKPKPVAFPDPTTSSVEIKGIRYINLNTLVELKIASGMSAPGRMKDLSDIVEMIKALDLPQDFAEKINPYVRDKYLELWKSSRRRYVMLWRNKFLTVKATSLDDMITKFAAATAELDAMKKDGVFLEVNSGVDDDYATLVTTDPKIAEKYGMVEESEYWGEADDEEVQPK